MRAGMHFVSLAVMSSLWGCVDAADTVADTPRPMGAGGSELSPSGDESLGLVPLNGPGEAFALLPDAAGWVASASNTLAIQGAWSTRTGTDSTIQISFDGPNVCFSGQAAQIPMGAMNAQYFGAAASFDFCRADAAAAPDAGFTLGSCPFAPELAQKLVGVGFNVNGTLPAVLRAGFREQGRMDTPYVVVREVGAVVALFEDALVRNNPAAELLHPENVQSIELLVPGNRQAARPFNFCVKNLAALTGPGWVSTEIPEWALVPGPGKRVDMVGVNIAGAEFGQQNLPGTYEQDYVYPSAADIDLFVDRGMNVIRLPFRWERLQQALGAELDATELGRLSETVRYATGRGVRLILDPHNFARYTSAGVAGIVGVDVDVAMFADLWRRLAQIFGDNVASDIIADNAVSASNAQVVFGLVNEPNTMPTEAWLTAANAAIAAIRETGAGNLILVPGNSWSGAHNWSATYYGTPNSVAMAGVVDPGNNFAFELHQYLDSDSSGTMGTCTSETIGSARMQDATNWLRRGGYRGLLAEFGAPANSTCLRALDNLMTFVGDNADVWMGWVAWAAGPRWGDNLLSVQPLANGKDRPQLVVIRRHLNDGVVSAP